MTFTNREGRKELAIEDKECRGCKKNFIERKESSARVRLFDGSLLVLKFQLFRQLAELFCHVVMHFLVGSLGCSQLIHHSVSATARRETKQENA
jgi:hypothetical protein